ncbi:hypothetical protein V6235_16735, partial [Vibrio metschnikovii]
CHFELNCCEQMNFVKVQCNQWVIKHNKRFKRDFQRVAFSLCVDFCGFSVMRKLGSSVVSPLSGRYALIGKMTGVNNESA